jgi:cysteine/O-acetylserine efflux protein
MTINFFAVISYALISIFTPGPSNISTASMAVVYGYKRTINYQMGLALGFFCVMLLSGWFSANLLNYLPFIEPILRYVGAGYILYLAISILKASYSVSENSTEPLKLRDGITLQLLNPKLIIFTLTLFSGFLSSAVSNQILLLLFSLGFAGLSFCSTSIWALFGTVIQMYLRERRYTLAINFVLSLSLIYIALSLIELV